MHGPQNDPARESSAARTDVPKLNLRRLETIQRWLQYVAVITLAVSVILIGFSSFELRRIKKQIEERKTELAELQKKKNDLQAELSASQTLNGAFSELTRSEKDPGQAEKIKRSIEDSISRNANPRQIPARIYLQIGGEQQRKRAVEVARQLQTRGYLVPGLEDKGVENVRGRAPRVSQIRYYQNDEVSQKDVNDIVGLLQGMGIQLKEVKFPSSANVRPRLYEIWFGDDF